MMGLGQTCCREAKRDRQLAEVGIGAKPLERDLGDVHTWPHSHYLMRQCNGVSARGEVRLNTGCAGACFFPLSRSNAAS